MSSILGPCPEFLMLSELLNCDKPFYPGFLKVLIEVVEPLFENHEPL
jgi:hypothetical protein